MMSQFWLYNPNILFKSSEIHNIWPTSDMTFEEKLNAVSRLVIILTFISIIATRQVKVLLSGFITLGVIILLYKIEMKKNSKKEGFTSQSRLYDAMKPIFTHPTEINPAMNILLPEINENPKRQKAAPAFMPMIEEDINTKTKDFIKKEFNDPTIDERLFNDLGDNFMFDQSMRTWHATPNTTIPNDQKSFAEYCYGDMISCRDVEDTELACVRNMPYR